MESKATDFMFDDGFKGLLKSVSRTFYLSIKWLPEAMRPGIAVAYLLARATDSAADAKGLSHRQRTQALQTMREAVLSGSRCHLPPELCAAADTPAESVLLRRFDEILRTMRTLPSGQVSLVQDVLSPIIQGQMWDISFFEEHSRVLSDEQTRIYIYRVAGCAGRFWTRLGRLTLGDAFCSAEQVDFLEQAATRYGCGLQLVNILRDREEDISQRGRDYLCSDPVEWMNRAERYLADGADYARRIRSRRVRMATVLPALLGLRTLAELRQFPPPGKRVKISRMSVYLCVIRAAFSRAK